MLDSDYSLQRLDHIVWQSLALRLAQVAIGAPAEQNGRLTPQIGVGILVVGAVHGRKVLGASG